MTKTRDESQRDVEMVGFAILFLPTTNTLVDHSSDHPRSVEMVTLLHSERVLDFI